MKDQEYIRTTIKKTCVERWNLVKFGRLLPDRLSSSIPVKLLYLGTIADDSLGFRRQESVKLWVSSDVTVRSPNFGPTSSCTSSRPCPEKFFGSRTHWGHGVLTR